MADCAQEEVKAELLDLAREVGLFPRGDGGLPDGAGLLEAVVKRRDELLAVAGDEVEAPLLELGVAILAGVQVCEDAVAGVEARGWHVGAREHVPLLHLAHVEQGGERLLVQKADHPGVLGDGRAGRHVDAEHGAVVLGHAAVVELLLALEPEVVQPVLDGAVEWHAIVSGDVTQGQSGRRRCCHSRTLGCEFLATCTYVANLLLTAQSQGVRYKQKEEEERRPPIREHIARTYSSYFTLHPDRNFTGSTLQPRQYQNDASKQVIMQTSYKALQI